LSPTGGTSNKRVLLLRDHGRQPGDRLFVNHEVAFKYKMSIAGGIRACRPKIDERVAASEKSSDGHGDGIVVGTGTVFRGAW
jgi:hypothetical protein